VPATSATRDRRSRLRSIAELVIRDYLAIGLALFGAALVTSRGIAADDVSVMIAILYVLPLLATTRAWELPWWLLVLAASLPCSVLVVALAHGELAGADRIGKYGFFAAFLVGVVAWARTPGRRSWLGIAVSALGLFGTVLAIASWIRGGDPHALLRGILGWHNQTAGFALAALALALVLLAIAAPPPAPSRAIGRAALAVPWSAAIVCGAGLLLTGSRFGSTLGACAAAVAVVLAIAIGVERRSWGPFVRVAVAIAGAVALAAVLRSPLVFPESDVGLSPVGAITSRGTGEGSLGARFDFWTAALGMGAAHPLTGVGLLRFPEFANCYADLDYWGWTPHNEWLYAWAEGGAVMLVPLLALTAGLLALVVRSIRPFPRADALARDPARWGGLVALVGSVAALALEYNLFYPPILAMIAGSGGIAIAGAIERRARSAAGRRLGIAAFALLAAVVIAGLAAVLLDPRAGATPWVPQAEYPHECPLD